jgi:hypothetical protein
MSVLAKNLKTVRKEIGCTQSVMSEILKVGFQTFARVRSRGKKCSNLGSDKNCLFG